MCVWWPALLYLSGYRGRDLLLRAPRGRAHVRRTITLAERLPVDAGLHFHRCTFTCKKLKPTIEGSGFRGFPADWQSLGSKKGFRVQDFEKVPGICIVQV